MFNTPRIDALLRLRPSAAWLWLDENDYTTLDWRDETQTLPTEEEIDAEVAKGASAPQVTTITPRQARLALFAAGILDQVEAAVDAAGGAVKISWEYATQINRHDPLIESIGPTLGLTDDQIDLIFNQAATL
jgi:hypothetical protein